MENARAMGERFRSGLGSLVTDGLALEVRGRGLMIGVQTASPVAREAVAIARVEHGLLVNATIRTPNRFNTGTSRRISSDCPLLLSRRARSPSPTSPRSPCNACVASRKHDGTPVLLKVAAIFCAMGAFLPTPLKISFPPA